MNPVNLFFLENTKHSKSTTPPKTLGPFLESRTLIEQSKINKIVSVLF